jgi:hypothetical protein
MHYVLAAELLAVARGAGTSHAEELHHTSVSSLSRVVSCDVRCECALWLSQAWHNNITTYSLGAILSGIAAGAVDVGAREVSGGAREANGGGGASGGSLLGGSLLGRRGSLGSGSSTLFYGMSGTTRDWYRRKRLTLSTRQRQACMVGQKQWSTGNTGRERALTPSAPMPHCFLFTSRALSLALGSCARARVTTNQNPSCVSFHSTPCTQSSTYLCPASNPAPIGKCDSQM